jgi:hypothetical protein
MCLMRNFSVERTISDPKPPVALDYWNLGFVVAGPRAPVNNGRPWRVYARAQLQCPPMGAEDEYH